MNIHEHLEGLKGIKPYLMKQMKIINYEGMGEQDAEDIGETIDCAIKAMEKQIPKKIYVYSDGYADGYEVWEEHCPICDYDFDASNFEFCPHCGQAIDWSEEE